MTMNPSDWLKRNLRRAFFRLFPLVLLASLADAALLGAIRLFMEILGKKVDFPLGCWLSGAFLLVVLRWGLSYLRGVSIEKMCRRLETGLLLWFARRLRTLAPKFFHEEKSEERLAVAYDAVHVVSFSAESLMFALQAVLQLLVFLPVLFFISPGLTLAVLLIVLPIVSFVQRKMQALKPSVEGEMMFRGKLRSEMEQAKRFYRLWCSGEELSQIGKKILESIRGVQVSGLSVGRRKVALSQGMEAFSLAAVVLVLAFCGWMILSGLLDAEGLVLYCSALFLCYKPVKECARLLPQIRLAKSAQDALQNLEREPRKRKKIFRQGGSLVFSDVGFSYGNSAQSNPVFECLNLKLLSGKPVLLQGPNGCGKSTFLRLVCGLEEPVSGKIFLPETLAENGIFFVSQDLILPDRDILLRRVRMLRGEGAFSKMMNLLSAERLLEKCGLSGGERAKVALLWALSSPAKMVLLDEPFAFIAEREREPILQSFLECAEFYGKWIFLASHEPVGDDLKVRFDVLDFSKTGILR